MLKKSLLAVSGLVLIGTLAFAHDHDAEIKMPDGQKEQCEKKPCCHRGMMGQGPMMSQMIATSDGGVIVLCGPKLYKYDKNLALKKAVDLPCGPGGEMQDGKDGDGMGMMEQCPGHHMDKPGMDKPGMNKHEEKAKEKSGAKPDSVGKVMPPPVAPAKK